MLTTVLASIVLFGLLFAGMAIGVLVANKPVKGSCGGLGNVGLGGECDICGGNPDKCDEGEQDGRTSARRAGELGRDVTRG